jgi:predicted metal-dependent phosphoesterase TrpH
MIMFHRAEDPTLNSDVEEMLVDPHTHSKFSDGLSTPLSMFRHAHRKGLSGMVITDHDTVRHWAASLEASHRTGVATAMGVEISTAQGHLLAYFDCETSPRRVARSLKLDQGTIHYLEAESVLRRIRELGGVACIPHPFGPFYPMGSKYFDQVDGIEEYNSWIFHDHKLVHNALGAAGKHGVAALGGSDSHYPYTLGFGATRIPSFVDFTKPDWFLACIRQRLTHPVIRQRIWQRRMNMIKSTVSIPLNMRYNVKFFRSKWRGYWREHSKHMFLEMTHRDDPHSLVKLSLDTSSSFSHDESHSSHEDIAKN